MITKPNKKTVKQSEDFKSYSFGIKKEGLAHIFNVLRNQLYSDKVLAVIREYSTNAVDAHAEVGKLDEPIKVTLPNQLSPYFKVRDYGRGLTEKQIGQIYAMYGESTKRGTNEQIGQLGLGSKSGFAYGDNFVITSWVKGKKTVYNAFLDPSKIGRIAKMEQSDSDEPQGIKITVPVKADDTESFRDKAFSLFERFIVTPNIKGVSKEELESQFDPKKIIVEADDKSWQILSSSSGYGNDSFAIMGNIAYPIDRNALNLPYADNRDKLLQCCPVNLHVPIGDLEVAASREALQYTDDTIAAILGKLDKIISTLPKILSRRFDDCETLWDAKKLFAETFNHGGFGYQLNNIIKKKEIKWNGTPVVDSHFSFRQVSYAKSEHGFSCHVYGKPKYFSAYNAKGIRVKREERVSIVAELTKDILIVEDDLRLDRGQFNKIAPLLEDYEGRPADMKKYDAVYLVDFGKYKKEIVDKIKFDAPMEKLSKLTHVKLTSIYPRTASANVNSHGVTADKKKHQSLEFTYDYDCSAGAWHNQRSAFFKAEAVNLDAVKDGIYIELDKFWVNFDSENKEAHPHSIGEFVRSVEKHFGIKCPKIYAFKTKSVHKVQSKNNWTTLSDWAYKQMTDHLEANGYCQTVKNAEHFKAHNSYIHQNDVEITDVFNGLRDFGRSDDQMKNIESCENLKKIVVEDSLLKEYLVAWNEMRPTKSDNKTLDLIGNVDGSGYCRRLNINVSDKIDKSKVKPTHNLFELTDRLLKRYPLLAHLEYRCWNNKKIEDLWARIVEYANLVDVTVVTKNRK
ncbi:MAG TPA: hypothetical protein DCM10_07100 [Xanthomarina gelatinilytica]|nr:hypothetical protein [Xanthomarina gelatinilytica]